VSRLIEKSNCSRFAKFSLLNIAGIDNFMTINYSKQSFPSELYNRQADPIFFHHRLENKK